MNEEKEQELQQAEQQYQSDKAEAIKAIKKFTDDNEDGSDDSTKITLKTILGGDILQSKFVLRQVGFCIFVVVLLLFYTGNRYASQQEILLIDSLKTELQEQRYNVLTINGELLNLSRQSKIEDALRSYGDSLISTPGAPLFGIKDQEE